MLFVFLFLLPLFGVGRVVARLEYRGDRCGNGGNLLSALISGQQEALRTLLPCRSSSICSEVFDSIGNRIGKEGVFRSEECLDESLLSSGVFESYGLIEVPLSSTPSSATRARLFIRPLSIVPNPFPEIPSSSLATFECSLLQPLRVSFDDVTLPPLIFQDTYCQAHHLEPTRRSTFFSSAEDQPAPDYTTEIALAAVFGVLGFFFFGVVYPFGPVICCCVVRARNRRMLKETPPEPPELGIIASLEPPPWNENDITPASKYKLDLRFERLPNDSLIVTKKNQTPEDEMSCLYLTILILVQTLIGIPIIPILIMISALCYNAGVDFPEIPRRRLRFKMRERQLVVEETFTENDNPEDENEGYHDTFIVPFQSIASVIMVFEEEGPKKEVQRNDVWEKIPTFRASVQMTLHGGRFFRLWNPVIMDVELAMLYRDRFRELLEEECGLTLTRALSEEQAAEMSDFTAFVPQESTRPKKKKVARKKVSRRSERKTPRQPRKKKRITVGAANLSGHGDPGEVMTIRVPSSKRILKLDFDDVEITMIVRQKDLGDSDSDSSSDSEEEVDSRDVMVGMMPALFQSGDTEMKAVEFS